MSAVGDLGFAGVWINSTNPDTYKILLHRRADRLGLIKSE